MASEKTGTHAVDPRAAFEYAPAPESRAVVDIKSSYGLFVNGEFTDPSGGHSFKTVSPATEEVLAEVAEASAEDVDAAVKAARRAYDKVWSTMPGRERATLSRRLVMELLVADQPPRERAHDAASPLWRFADAG